MLRIICKSLPMPRMNCSRVPSKTPKGTAGAAAGVGTRPTGAAIAEAATGAEAGALAETGAAAADAPKAALAELAAAASEADTGVGGFFASASSCVLNIGITNVAASPSNFASGCAVSSESFVPKASRAKVTVQLAASQAMPVIAQLPCSKATDSTVEIQADTRGAGAPFASASTTLAMAVSIAFLVISRACSADCVADC